MWSIGRVLSFVLWSWLLLPIMVLVLVIQFLGHTLKYAMVGKWKFEDPGDGWA